MNKNTKIIFRLSDSEKAAAEKVARSNNLTVSEFLRSKIHEAAGRLQTGEKRPELQRN